MNNEFIQQAILDECEVSVISNSLGELVFLISNRYWDIYPAIEVSLDCRSAWDPIALVNVELSDYASFEQRFS